MGDKELMIEIISESEKEIRAIIKKGGKWYDVLDSVARLASNETEKFAGIDWTGKDKKKFALDLSEALWFQYANQKRLPDFIERPLVRFIADRAIETFVALMNRLGKWKHKTT